MDSLYYSGI